MRNGEVLADNRTVCTISVIHSQIEDPEAVIRMLVKELELPEEIVQETGGKGEFHRAYPVRMWTKKRGMRYGITDMRG